MKTTVMLVVCLLPTWGLAAEKGDVAFVPGWSWVEPINRPAMGSFPASCGIERGGQLTVLASDAEGVLVEYQPGGEPWHGTPCKGGERFLLSHSAFEAMTPIYEAGQAVEQAKRARIQQLERQIK